MTEDPRFDQQEVSDPVSSAALLTDGRQSWISSNKLFSEGHCISGSAQGFRFGGPRVYGI